MRVSWDGGGGSRTIAQKSLLGKHERRRLSGKRSRSIGRSLARAAATSVKAHGAGGTVIRFLPD